MQRIIDIISVMGGVVGTTAVPVLLAVINKRNKADAQPQATFGIPMTVESAVDRGDRIANDYLADLRLQRDEAKSDVDSLEVRLAAANAALHAAGLPTF